MADTTPPKRVLPARERRESAAKRRAISPPPVSSPPSRKTPNQSSEPRQKRKYVKRASLLQPSTPSTDFASPAAEDILPTRLITSKALPTSRQKQPVNLSDQDYQSIGDSNILAASLSTSRTQWLCDGIFKKYWTKPIKRKGITEVPPNNPDLKSMQRLGNATMTIEPHVFDVTFYTVRDTQASTPYYRHPNQHTPKTAFPNPPPPPQYGPQPPYTRPPSIPPSVSGPSLSVVKSPSNSSPPVAASSPILKKEESLHKSPMATPSTPMQIPLAEPEAASSNSAVNGQPKQTPPTNSNPSTDPVIQMLASRAASDPRLKDLMKVVATSKATPEQLKIFQTHIDELNALVRRQEIERAKLEQEGEPKSLKTSSPAQPLSKSADKADVKSRANSNNKSTISTHSASPGAAHPAMYNAMASRSSIPPAGPTFATTTTAGPATFPPYMAYPHPPKPETIVKHIVFEFTSTASLIQPASQDRWFFPEYAVLDLRYGGLEMTCSFFVERKGSDILHSMNNGASEHSPSQAKWKADREYYQPVTMTVRATQHRIIETIARAAKSLPAVQEHMKEVMKDKTRAPQEYLIHRLPREKGHAKNELDTGPFVDSGVDIVSDEEDDDLKDYYGI